MRNLLEKSKKQKEEFTLRLKLKAVFPKLSP
jgi:hypothetical protein